MKDISLSLMLQSTYQTDEENGIWCDINQYKHQHNGHNYSSFRSLLISISLSPMSGRRPLQCNDRGTSLSSKIRLMRSLVTSIFPYACDSESWTLTAELQRRMRAMEMSTCYCKTLRISYKDHVTNEEVCANIQQAIRPVSYTHLTLPTTRMV